MNRSVLDTLDNSALAWSCIEPTIQIIRGKNFNIKSEVYDQLTAGQRALLMFWVFYGHTQTGVAQFYGDVSYLLAQADIWSELKKSMRYFRDDAMLGVLQKMEDVYRILLAKNQLEFENCHRFSADDIKCDSELSTTISRLDEVLPKIEPNTINRMADYIRNNLGEFLQIEESWVRQVPAKCAHSNTERAERDWTKLI
ncbi:hypothetical protein CEB3_c02770 [Peptococcaceae bacterium CEB3]|nr:hypothetical protein CEB3_c02770 [Peptococcaceae bacterium CEB3]